MDDDKNSNHSLINEDDENKLNMKQKKRDIDVNFGVIERFLECGSYPATMKGRPDLKANLRKQCKRYMLNKGVLHFRYGQHKAKSNSKAPAYLRVIKDKAIRKKIL